MYSMVLMMAMSTSPEAAAFGKRNSCNGCTGGTSCSGMVEPAPASCNGCSGGCTGESCNGGKHKMFGGNGLFGGGGGLFKKHKDKGCSGGESCHGGCNGSYVPSASCHGGAPVYGIPVAPVEHAAPCCGSAPIHVAPIEHAAPSCCGSAPIIYTAPIVEAAPTIHATTLVGNPVEVTPVIETIGAPKSEPKKEAPKKELE